MATGGEGGTVEQQIERLKELEQDLLQLIDRTSQSPNDRPENIKAQRLLNQIQLRRISLETETIV